MDWTARLPQLAYATLLAIVATGVLGFIASSWDACTDPAPGIARHRAMAAFTREVAHARALGLAAADEGEVTGTRDERPIYRPLHLQTGQCAAVVATAWGSHRIFAVYAGPRRAPNWFEQPLDALGADPGTRALAAHAQWCQRPQDPTELVISILAYRLAWRPEREAHTVRWQLLRAPRASLRAALDRGWVLHDSEGNVDRGGPVPRNGLQSP